jgi:hypothetical protein
MKHSTNTRNKNHGCYGFWNPEFKVIKVGKGYSRPAITRAFERVYEIEFNTFDYFGVSDNSIKKIKSLIQDKKLNNIKEKNNMKVFEETTKEEWEEIIEIELINFLTEIVN